jgi:anti-sigma B factor antagonist
VPITDSQVHDGLLVVQQASEGERLRLTLHGEIDLANAETAEAILREAVASGKDVVIDLGKLEFIDSTGIAVLVTAMREVNEQRLSFLPSEHDPVRRVLNLTGLEERMTFASPVEVAPGAVPESLLPAA